MLGCKDQLIGKVQMVDDVLPISKLIKANKTFFYIFLYTRNPGSPHHLKTSEKIISLAQLLTEQRFSFSLKAEAGPLLVHFPVSVRNHVLALRQ